ncbi:MAG TPA: hypothetical protein VK887_16805 [Pseudonocardiaceae bacterium]|nr:hypothetical protein [Pseudonocardiaceae bacterium]
MTSIPLQQDEIKVCGIGELGGWEAMDAYRAAFAAASADELTGRGSAAYYLRQAALETVIARRMRVRAVISIHHALLTGVSLGEIAHVLGNSRRDVAQRWRAWADGQLRLNTQCPGLGLGQREYDQVAAVIGAEVSDQGSDGGLGGCACQGMDTQIGSPRP